ncbi:MAG: hypothetical protein ABIB43_04260 [archaeon]
MGINLTIMPLKDKESLKKALVYTYVRLCFVSDYNILGQIGNVDGESAIPDSGIEAVVKTYSLPKEMLVHKYDDEGMNKTRDNPFGEEMVYTLAGEFRKIKAPRKTSSVNKAILAYVRKLDKETPIILEWR